MNFFRQNLYLILAIICVILIALSIYFFSSTFPKKEVQVNNQPQSQATSPSTSAVAGKPQIVTLSVPGGVLCSVSIEQPNCYEGNFPTPTFKWTYCNNDSAKNQKTFRIQVDDKAYQNDVFPSPEFDSGNISSLDTTYAVNSQNLKFNTAYYWGVTVIDKSGGRQGWWGWGDKIFSTAPSCK